MFFPFGKLGKMFEVSRAFRRIADEPVELIVTASQFAKKLQRRALDAGFDVADIISREAFATLIQRTFRHAAEVRKGLFRGQTGAVFFYRRGTDVVVVKPSGEFITLLTDGGTNPSFLRAEVVAQ